MSKLTGAHIHRFGDRVALSLPGKGETVYLSAAQARALAKHLNAGARSIKKEKFADSNFGSPVVELTNEGKI